jgi:hypothetical protein
MILMVLDAAKERENDHRSILERELETVGYVVAQSVCLWYSGYS